MLRTGNLIRYKRGDKLAPVNYFLFENVLTEEQVNNIPKDPTIEDKVIYEWDDLKWAHPLLRIAKQYVPEVESDCIGYEMWHHPNLKPKSWHFDKDEYMFYHHEPESERTLNHPLCGLIYYIEVKDLKGGRLIFENGDKIVPIQNNLVLFDGNIMHMVEEFNRGEGIRNAVIINCWASHSHKRRDGY